MKRREVLKAFTVAPAAALGLGAVRAAPHVWGPVTIERHAALRAEGIDLHIYCNDLDITRRCRFFDDTPGQRIAELFKVTPEGRFYLDHNTDGPAKETITEFEIRAWVRRR